jgi:hypothetical protein
MKIEAQKSGHVIQKYIMDRISEIEGAVLVPTKSMEVVMDQDGAYWLCNKGIEQEDELENQGCWKCRDKFVMR